MKRERDVTLYKAWWELQRAIESLQRQATGFVIVVSLLGISLGVTYWCIMSFMPN